METKDVLGADYQPRVLDDVLGEALQTAGAVVIEGPRACGKTMTALNSCVSYAFLDDEATEQLAQVAPASVLSGATPRLLDEWQLAPHLWNQVRRQVDKAGKPGQFILTGSAVPRDDLTRHTGAGRFLRLRQYTMSWWERGLSDGSVSLAELFEGKLPDPASPQCTYPDLVGHLVQSGFPALKDLPRPRASRLLRAYLQEVSRVDMGRLEQVRHEPAVIERLLHSLARSTASETNLRTIAADLAMQTPDIKPETVARYIEVLERLFVVERQNAWSPTLRTRARLRTADKWHLADPALAVAALAADEEQLAADPATVGLLLESAAVHDLRVLASSSEARVHHYRDSNGHEIDAVIVLPDGRWAAVEVKISQSQIVAGARTLNTAVAQIDHAPEFRLVLTGTGGTYVLDDGTVTCSLASLRP